MTDPIQEVHAAHDTSDAADSASSNPPVLKPIGSGDDLSKYKMTCNIESVYYYSRNQSPTCAAVLLNFDFDLAGASLRFVKLPTRIVGVQKLEGFPLSEQLIFDSSKHVDEHAILQLVRSYIGQLDGIMWMFITRDGYFPYSVKILLDVENYYEDLPYPFRFSLQIPPRFEICIKPKSWWHFWTTSLRPRDGHQGCSCDIEEDYHPEIAKNILLKHKKLREEMDRSQALGLGIMIVYGYDPGLLPT
ncbi:hypothetical protein DEU56DRAFT_789791 [Suillus clintonianus]|uniref:uncharacterized protein n=1 Tax=Suillus clintonianus TaxID=1904413 RepID=UPI001B86A36F|nr:uncharacterized protein DEU56DRAFT_789791 [Suillus clintonianus]KAG2144478.1 hypothetical protein DEU56DRAFT_789791 [Suillus clintonianus]